MMLARQTPHGGGAISARTGDGTAMNDSAGILSVSNRVASQGWFDGAGLGLWFRRLWRHPTQTSQSVQAIRADLPQTQIVQEERCGSAGASLAIQDRFRALSVRCTRQVVHWHGSPNVGLIPRQTRVTSLFQLAERRASRMPLTCEAEISGICKRFWKRACLWQVRFERGVQGLHATPRTRRICCVGRTGLTGRALHQPPHNCFRGRSDWDPGPARAREGPPVSRLLDRSGLPGREYGVGGPAAGRR